MVLIYNKKWWLDSIGMGIHHFTKDEIEAVDMSKGDAYLGKSYGIDCYITRFIDPKELL